MRTCLLAVPAMLAIGCIDPAPSTSHISKPVIGGEITPEGEFPGVGALYLTSFGSFECTGTLIAPDVVLTAAHCIAGAPETPDFTLAHDTVSTVPPLVQTASAIAHENFDITTDPGSGPGTWYDIALMFLSTPITSVAPIKLPSPDEANTMDTGTELALVGYGVIVDGGDTGGVMYDAVTDLVTRGDAELQISTPGAPQNCYGDSGGPALYDVGGEYRVVGVVSRSASGNTCTTGGIDTRVDYYLDWIHAHAPQVCIPGMDCTTVTPDAAPAVPDAEVIDHPDAATGPDAGDPAEEGDGGGCCSTGGGGGPAGSALLALAVGAVIGRRRRRA